ncbi:MAG: restriction endonuclease subunit S [Candidatus Oxydemutatoraceae bacterium WSBS_2016_MAG_OTU14]
MKEAKGTMTSVMTKAKAGAKATATPELRFPEFRDKGAWEVKRLEEVCEILNNRREPITSANREKGKYPYYGASGVIDFVNNFIFDERLVLVGEDGAKWSAFERSAFIVEGKCWVNNHAHVLKATAINEVLLENYLVMLNLEPFITGAAPPKLTLGRLKHISIPLPIDITEQQKIADCLTSLDELIGAEDEKLSTLKDHKKGLLQKLFPAEGKTTPELRFPEFRGKGAWEVKRLEDVCRKITQGGTPDTSNHSYWNGAINWLTPAEMGKTGDYFIHTTARKITPLGFRNCSSDLLPVHSVIVSTRAPIGHLAINKSEMAINQGCKGLIPKDTTNHNFLYYFLLNFKFLLMDLGAGSTFKELTGNDLKKFKILFPSFKEQQKIADCLTSLDALISAENEKLSTLKDHKKGLLQKLFPIQQGDKG